MAAASPDAAAIFLFGSPGYSVEHASGGRCVSLNACDAAMPSFDDTEEHVL